MSCAQARAVLPSSEAMLLALLMLLLLLLLTCGVQCRATAVCVERRVWPTPSWAYAASCMLQ